MSRYTVVWWPKALAELAEFWLAADDRESVTADADEIDRRFAEQATEWGSPLDSNLRNLRWMDLSKLRAYFKISEPDRLVEVVSVVGLTKDRNGSQL